MLGIGSVGEDLIANAAIIDDVRAKPKVLVDHGRQRLDAIGIDLAKLFHPAKDIVEFGHKALKFVLTHRDARELGDVPDLFGRN